MGQIKVSKCEIDGLYVIEPTVHNDGRGYFMETYNQKDMEEAGLNTGSTVTPVIPVIVGDAEKAEELSARLYEKGVYAQAIKFPVVPRGTARLRVMISAAHTREDLEKAADAIIEITKEMGII